MMIKSTYCIRLAALRCCQSFSARCLHMGRVVPEIEPDLEQQLHDQIVNPKKLITRRNYGMTHLPAQLYAIAEDKIQRYSDKTFRQEAKYLIRVMHNMKLPDDPTTLKLKKADVKSELEIRDKIEPYDPEVLKLSEESRVEESRLSEMIKGIVTERRRDWHYYEYDERASLMYMATRLPNNYACIKTVMNEIRAMDPEFKPKSVLDFGSGMGTTTWAVNETWPTQVNEFMNVELSREQQYLCEYLLRGGKESGEDLPGVFHKQYLPSSTRVKYDMVVAAFSLLELPSRELRAHTIENLWNKTQDLLVLVERGNKGGFDTINEARHLVLDLAGHDVTKKIKLTAESRPVKYNKHIDAHVLAPCSHEFACPRMSLPNKRDMNICSFKVFFEALDIGERKPGRLMEEFSYVVLRKRPHPMVTNDKCNSACSARWPRIVERRKGMSKHVIHNLCCPNGHLAETIFTKKKHGTEAYRLAKSCDWGDILPIKVKDTYEVKNSRQIKDR